MRLRKKYLLHLAPHPLHGDEHKISLLYTLYYRSLYRSRIGLHLFRILRQYLQASSISWNCSKSIFARSFFNLLRHKIPKDLLRNKCRNQFPYLCCFHTLKLLSGLLSIVPLIKALSYPSPSQHIKMRISQMSGCCLFCYLCGDFDVTRHLYQTSYG